MDRLQLVSVKQVASILDLDERALRNKIQPNSKHPFPVKPIRIGRNLKFDLRDIEAYVASLKEPTECEATHPEK
jgi:hypothetical protein